MILNFFILIAISFTHILIGKEETTENNFVGHSLIYEESISPETAHTPVLALVVDVQYDDFEFGWFGSKKPYTTLISWKMYLTLDNGLRLTIHNYDIYARYKYHDTAGIAYSPYVHDEMHNGDTIELVEYPLTSTQSEYTIRDLQTEFFYGLDRETGRQVNFQTEYVPNIVGDAQKPISSQ